MTKPSTPVQSIKLLFAGLMVTQLLSALNQTVLSSALPTIVGELDGVAHMTWVITAFILAATITMPIYGKLSDLLGRKPLLIAAITIFVAGSIVGALAPDMTTLIIARAIQGLGGGGLMILSQAAIADVIPARDRGKYMGIMGAVFAVSSVAGPLLGGWFTEGPGWGWAFWINLPLGALALVAPIVLLNIPRPVLAVRPKLDYLGMVLISLATTAIVLTVTWGGTQYEWTSPTILALSAAALIASVAFVLVEKRAEQPIMPLFLFKDRNFNLTTISALATGVAMFGAIGYTPTYLQMAGGYSATIAGLLMTPMMGFLLISSIVSGIFVSRTGKYKSMPIIGSFILAVGLLLLSTIKADTSIVITCLYLGVIGLGLGMSMQILTLIVQNSFPLRHVGTATASSNYFRQVGATLGSAVVGSVFASRLLRLVSEHLGEQGSAVGDTNSFTPAMLHELPPELLGPIVTAYNEALMPIFLYLVPLAVASGVVLFFLKEKPLATSIERDLAEPLEESAVEFVVHNEEREIAQELAQEEKEAAERAAKKTAKSGVSGGRAQ